MSNDHHDGTRDSQECETRRQEKKGIHESSVSDMLAEARTSQDVLGMLLERYRPYLTVIAEQHIYDQLRVRMEPADVVQATLSEVARSFPQFRGTTEPELSSWVKRILADNIKDGIRQHVGAGKRTIEKERRLHFADESASFSWQNPPRYKPPQVSE